MTMPGAAAAVVAGLLEARPRLRALPVEERARGLSMAAGAWCRRDAPDRQGIGQAMEAGTGYSRPVIDAGLDALFSALAGDAGLRRAMSVAARRHVETHHEIGRAARALLAALERLLAHPARIDPVVPPLAPWSADDPRIALAASIGADVADLGLAGAAGEELLVAVAGTLAELDWAPRPDRRR